MTATGDAGCDFTVIVVDVVVAVHLQGNAAVGSRPSLDADALVQALLQGALSVSRAAVLASR
jgi:hypothetical protein